MYKSTTNLAYANNNNNKLYFTNEQIELLTLLFNRDKKYKEFVHFYSINYDAKNNPIFKREFWLRTTDIDNSEKMEKFYIKPGLDYYITANTLTNPKDRTQKKLFSFHNIVIDMDMHSDYNTNTLTQAINTICKYLNSINFPEPNVLHWTGRGVQLWWHIERASALAEEWYRETVSMLAEQIQNTLTKHSFINVEVDMAATKNTSGIFRFFDTINTKSMTTTKAEILHQESFNLIRLKEILKKHKKKKTQSTKKKKTFNIGTPKQFNNLLEKRLKFIEDSIQFEGRTINNEMRNCRIFLYYNTLKQLYEHQEAITRTQKLNQQFLEPLSEKELQNIISSIDSYGHLTFSQERFFEFGNFDENLWLTQKEATKRKNKLKKTIRNLRIKAAAEKGMKQKDIANLLHIDRTTVYRALKTIKNSTTFSGGDK